MRSKLPRSIRKRSFLGTYDSKKRIQKIWERYKIFDFQGRREYRRTGAIQADGTFLMQ